jgi:hypothetical protein
MTVTTSVTPKTPIVGKHIPHSSIFGGNTVSANPHQIGGVSNDVDNLIHTRLQRREDPPLSSKGSTMASIPSLTSVPGNSNREPGILTEIYPLRTGMGS